MKKRFLLGILLIGLLIGLFLLPQITQAEVIDNFSSLIKINSDSSINVTETIVYDFGNDFRHGLNRYVPYSYNVGSKIYNLNIKVVSVTDENGKAYSYTVSDSSGKKNVQIGDPNSTINGTHTYVIDYIVKNAINYFNDHDELYWNVVGGDWTIAINKAAAVIELPAPTISDNLQLACYTGNLNSKTSCQEHNIINSQAVFSQSNLLPGQYLTIVLRLPKGMVIQTAVVQASFWQNIWLNINSFFYILPLLVLLFMWFLWRRKGRDPLGFTTIIAQYDAPANLSPVEAGVIIKEKMLPRYISAEIINLAVLGYIKITYLQEKVLGFMNNVDYQLNLLKPAGPVLTDFQKQLITDIFGKSTQIKISQLNNSFKIHLFELNKLTMKGLVAKKYFPADPSKIKKFYFGIGMPMLFLGFIFFSSHLGLALLLSAIIIMIFSSIMPRRTILGAKAKQYILGLKLYLSVAEKDRLKFFDAPEATPEKFEKLLPYAIVLKVENEWAKQFKNIYNQAPIWYSGSYNEPFSTVLLINSMSGFFNSANTVFSPSGSGSAAASGMSGFGGGGFSGGGFGGGGGGSW